MKRVQPWAAALSLALAPWSFRALALAGETRGFALTDLRGFGADLAVAALLLPAAWGLAHLARPLAAASVALLALGYYANYETVTALGVVASPLDVRFLADPTFVGGSAFAVARPLWLVVVVVASGVLAWVGLPALRTPDVAAALVLGSFGLGALLLLAPDPRYTEWRQVNALQHNVAWLALREPERTGEAGDRSPAAVIERVPELAADLDAPPRFAFDGRGHNVLLVVLESVSGAYLEAAARANGREVAQPMRRLDAVFSRNVGYANVVGHQRRTNRGLYAILCGELPRLLAGTPKMTVAAARPWQRCLPRILADAGYRSVFLQGAPLAFMSKDRFMPVAGFDEVLGDSWFRTAHLRTRWGVDDRSFFEQALEKVEALRAEASPWFLTLLTVGTHHPHVVPDDFESPFKTKFRRAFDYLDLHAARFLRELERRGVRRDTLVLVTSDESAGDLGRSPDALAGGLSHNWVFAAALLPGKQRALVTDPYAQSDLALTILDYLGLGDEASGLIGRSLLRRYTKPLPIFFGNVNHRIIGGFDGRERMVSCPFEGHRCLSYRVEPGRLFPPTLVPMASDPEFDETIREVARRSRPPEGLAPMPIPLLTDPFFPVRESEEQNIQGIAQVSLQPDEWFEVEFDVEARGDGRTELSHSLRLSTQYYVLSAKTRIDAGQTLRVRYTFGSELPVPQVTMRTAARLIGGDGVDLHFTRRRFLLRRSGTPPPVGLQIERYDLDPPSQDPEAQKTWRLAPADYRDYLERLAAFDIGGD